MKRGASLRDKGFAAVTNDKRLTFFNTKKRNKKKAEVTVGPFKISPRQTAGRANAGIGVKDFYFG